MVTDLIQQPGNRTCAARVADQHPTIGLPNRKGKYWRFNSPELNLMRFYKVLLRLRFQREKRGWSRTFQFLNLVDRNWENDGRAFKEYFPRPWAFDERINQLCFYSPNFFAIFSFIRLCHSLCRRSNSRQVRANNQTVKAFWMSNFAYFLLKICQKSLERWKLMEISPLSHNSLRKEHLVSTYLCIQLGCACAVSLVHHIKISSYHPVD